MIQFPEEFDSVFRYVEVVAQRAQQIIGGAKPRVESSATKPTLQARDDVDAGAVGWRVLTQEELDAQRQAMVEQFKAEMAGDERGPEPDRVRDVLPTGPAPAAAGSEDDERDDELVRLQQLLGLMGGRTADVAARDDDEDESEQDEADEDKIVQLDLEDEDSDDEDEDD